MAKQVSLLPVPGDMFGHPAKSQLLQAGGMFRCGMAICLLTLGSLCSGCGSDSPSGPSIPGGGQEYVLDAAIFANAIEPILIAKGCDSGGDCHGGGIRGSYQLSPQEAKSTTFDFNQSSLQVNGYDPLNSPFLTEPLAVSAGGTAHGFVAFDSTDDPDWQTLRDWVLAGQLR